MKTNRQLPPQTPPEASKDAGAGCTSRLVRPAWDDACSCIRVAVEVSPQCPNETLAHYRRRWERTVRAAFERGVAWTHDVDCPRCEYGEICRANVKHMRPSPATTEGSDINESQATQEPPSTTAGEGLHDANCCASDLFDGLSFECKKSLWRKLTLELGSKENRKNCKDIEKLAYDFKFLVWDNYTPNEIRSLSAFGEF